VAGGPQERPLGALTAAAACPTVIAHPPRFSRRGWAYRLPEVASVARLIVADAATSPYVLGSPEATAEAGTRWLETELRRPTERIDWVEHGVVVSCQWRFADTGTGLVVRGTRRSGIQTTTPLRPDRRG
jgi:hypothetical protein